MSETNVFRKMDEISAEDEIREAFKVFDSVNKTHFYNMLTSRTLFESVFFFRMEMVSSTGKS